MWSATGRSVCSATPRQVSTILGVAPQSSWILKPPAPARTARSSSSREEEEPRARNATLIGASRQPSMRLWRLYAGLAPTSHTPPMPMPTREVTPAASAAGTTSALERWTWESTMPGVAMSPSPVIIAVWESTTSSTPSVFSGLPARPTPTIRPSLTPMLVLRTPSSGSMTTTPRITMSRALSRGARPVTSSPSRVVLPQPPSSSSPGSVSSPSTRTHRSVSASRIRSPVVGP